MTVELSRSQRQLIAEIASREEIEGYELETKEGGEGSFGYITAVTIKGKDGKKLELILKSASTNERVRNVNPIRLAYLREIYIYEDILTAFEDFQRGLEVVDGFSAYPKIYGSVQDENNECLALENLNESGFRLWDRKIPMNQDHVTLVFTEYAKFHAVSLAMSHKRPCLFHELTNDLTNVFESHSLVMAKAALEFGRKAVVGNSLATKAIERLTGLVEYFLNVELEHSGSKIVVIHKDGWCNNLMFKYEDPQNSTRPTKANIIDWQLAERGSPVLDLAYFLYTCGSIETIINYPVHLKTYHDVLTESLSKLSCDAGELYPFDLLAIQWHKYSKFGLLMALIMIKFMLSEAGEVPNISQMARTGMSYADRLNFESVNDEDYNVRIEAIITVLERKALI